jgi:hypothetical protein
MLFVLHNIANDGARLLLFRVEDFNALHYSGNHRKIMTDALALRHRQRTRKRANSGPNRDADSVQSCDVCHARYTALGKVWLNTREGFRNMHRSNGAA